MSAPAPSRSGEDQKAILAATSDIATAPRDGKVISVLHGPFQIVEHAYWHPGLKNWVSETGCEVLHLVSRWLDGSKFLKPKSKPRK